MRSDEREPTEPPPPLDCPALPEAEFPLGATAIRRHAGRDLDGVSHAEIEACVMELIKAGCIEGQPTIRA